MDPIETLNGWAESWAGFMLYQSIDAAIALLIVGGLWLLLRRRLSAQVGYCLFLLVLLKATVPSPVSVPGLLGDIFPRQATETGVEGEGFGLWWMFGMGGEGQGAPTTQIAEADRSASKEMSAGPSFSILSILMLSWGTIAFVLLLRIAVHQWRLYQRLQKAEPLDPHSFPVNLDQLRQIAGVKHKARWVTCSWVNAPVVWGLLRPTIAVPTDLFTNLSRNQIEWILLHELAHIRRGDNAVSFAQGILQAFFFFHPAVWIANVLVDQQREYACDDAALIGTKASRRDCGEGFLEIVFQTDGLPTFMPASLGMINYKTFIRRRLMRILDGKRTLHSGISLSAGIFVVVTALLVLPFGGRMAVAQIAQWTRVIDGDETNAPLAAIYGMCYDSVRNVVVLHGGTTPEGTVSRATWEYDGKGWTGVSLDGPVRYAFGMAFDENRKVVLLFGGYNRGDDSWSPATYGSNTWEWNGVEWSEAATDDGASQAGAALAYYPDLKAVIRHGGATGSAFTSVGGDTWKWDSATWTKITDGPVRAGHKMVYDSVRNKILLFGGIDRHGSAPGDTWEFDGTTWQQVSTSGPEGREVPGLAFDASRGITVLFGGIITGRHGFSTWKTFADTWEWNGDEWNQVDRRGPSTFAPDLAYDSQRRTIVLYRGTSTGSDNYFDTWEYGTFTGMQKSLWSLY